MTSPSVQDFAGLRDEKSDQHDSRNAAMGVALVKFAHEFANELSFVSGAMQFLENDIERPHQARNALQHVKSGIQRLDSLLNELRTLAQPQRLSLQPTQLASVIKELLAIEEPRYAASRIRVETDLLPNLPPILLDASKFRQALVNLCRNAVDAMPHGGSLTLRGYLTHSKRASGNYRHGRGDSCRLGCICTVYDDKTDGHGGRVADRARDYFWPWGDRLLCQQTGNRNDISSDLACQCIVFHGRQRSRPSHATVVTADIHSKAYFQPT